MFVVGLTGGIGSGKSTVADLFVQRGAALVDTDAIAHELTGPGGVAMPALCAAFGDAIRRPDGGLDRASMRRLVFADVTAKLRLEAILHPLIRRESERRCTSASAAYVILAVPLLIESGSYRERCDRILVVDCSEETQLSRVVARSGMEAAEVRAIMATQASRPVRLAAADDCIDNEGGPAALAEQVEKLHQAYLAAALSKVKAIS
ncbi:MAG: dephospho-CoA kinase [Betaproteobacteria bacterium]|nr:dephospho-CoA kinase [Betaproteobacteria bacterium]